MGKITAIQQGEKWLFVAISADVLCLYTLKIKRTDNS